jgi:hypothetical protein
MASIVKDTFAALGRTPGWLANAAHTLMGSRFFVATSGLFFVAFLGHVTFASHRFPPITKVAIAPLLGFAPPLETAPEVPGVVSEQARLAADAGIPYLQPYIDQARTAVATFFGTTPDAVVWGNYTGLALSGVFFILGLYLMARQEVRTR